MIVGAATSSQQPTKVGDAGTAKSSPTPTAQAATTYQVGDKITLDKVILTVNNVERSQGGQFSKPSAGNTWVNLNLTLENTGSAQEFIATGGQMFLLDAKGNQYQTAVSDKVVDNPNASLDGTLIAGAKKTGWVGFEVPAGVTGLKFQYTPSFWDNRKIEVALP